MTAADRQSSPAAERNRQPILDVLRRVLPPAGRALDIASANAAVLPLPVLACASRSWPASATGRAAAWIGVIST